MTTKWNERSQSLLKDPNPCVIATIGESGVPQLSVIWIDLEDDEPIVVTFQTAAKTKNMRRDPRVVLEIINDKNIYEYLTITGRAREVDSRAGAQLIDRLALKYSGELYRGHHLGREWAVFAVEIERMAYYSSDIYP